MDAQFLRKRFRPGSGLALELPTGCPALLLLLLLGGFFFADRPALGAELRLLNGTWRMQLDRDNIGIRDEWFKAKLASQARLPGVLSAQGIGDDISTNTVWTGGIVDRSWFTSPEFAPYRVTGNVKVPFWLQPDKYYSGAAWYQREIDIPEAWKDRRIILSLERPHWETTAWIDGRILGTNNSLSTPHEYELGQLTPGSHVLTIRVDNRRIVDIGQDSHGISDHTQGNWNGIVGQITLQSTARVWIDDLQIYPHVISKSITVKGTIGNSTGVSGRSKLTLAWGRNEKTVDVEWNAVGGEFESELALGASAQLWDEFSPVLLELRAALNEDIRSTKFGLRELTTDGTQFLINGRKMFFRGTLECCIFPRTGHPPTDIAEWRRIIRSAKGCGLNLLRFHSYCPPDEAFVAADELGMYLQVETCWANSSTSLGDGHPVDEWVYAETAKILRAYGNHPSFMLMPYGNEPGGRNAHRYLARYVSHFKALDPRRLWTSGSGWPQIAENQFHVTPDPRIQAWGQGLTSRVNGQPPETTTDYRDYVSARHVPVISHEIGQWCVYPNFDEIPKYTGYLKPKNFEIFRDRLRANGLDHLSRQFLLASGKLQALCYKEDIESALRTPGMGGFELLDLHDFPGQGTALVGVLDPFWDEKGYITRKQYQRFCAATVPLARLSKRVYTRDEQLAAHVEISHFGPEPLKDARVMWMLVNGAQFHLAEGAFPRAAIPVDNGISIGNISIDLNSIPAPSSLKLVVRILGHRNEVVAENDWDVWVYPEKSPDSSSDGVLVTSVFDSKVRQRLLDGENVLLTLPAESVRNYDKFPVKLGFSSIFWNTAWTQRQAPTTLGILCDPKHPALARFPTDYYSNWQWWYLIHKAGALRLDFLPPHVEPIVRVIDDWFTARSLALVFEATVGKGRIIVCGFDLTGDLHDPVSRQMRESLLHYMSGRSFHPKVDVTADQVGQLIRAR